MLIPLFSIHVKNNKQTNPYPTPVTSNHQPSANNPSPAASSKPKKTITQPPHHLLHRSIRRGAFPPPPSQHDCRTRSLQRPTHHAVTSAAAACSQPPLDALQVHIDQSDRSLALSYVVNKPRPTFNRGGSSARKSSAGQAGARTRPFQKGQLVGAPRARRGPSGTAGAALRCWDEAVAA